MPPSYDAFPSGPRDGDPRAPALVLTRDRQLVDVLQRLAAAAGVELDVRDELPSLGRWAGPGLAMVGADLVAAAAAALPRRSRVFVVGLQDHDQAEVSAEQGNAIWQHALELGAEQVAFLPERQGWVVDALAESLDGSHRAAVVGVIGGCGGAGASVFATATAVAASRAGRRTLLVDLDCWGGGLDMLLGAEPLSGLRWRDLSTARGRLGPGLLREALPRLDELSVLSWERGDVSGVPALAAAAVAAGALRGFDLVVLDLPRSLAGVAPCWLQAIDVGVIVLPPTLRACAAAGRVVAALDDVVADLRAIVRGPASSRVPAELVADLLGLPLLGELRAEPGLASALDRGEPPGVRARAPLSRMVTRLLESLPPLGNAA